MSILSTFPETLNDLMMDGDIKAINLAKLLGLGTSTLSRYIRGQQLPNLECLVKLADYFNCTTDYLLGLEEENYPQEFLPCPPFAERLVYLLEYFKLPNSSIYQNKSISKARFYVWKNGKGLPNADNLVILAKIFNCSVDFVIGRTKA